MRALQPWLAVKVLVVVGSWIERPIRCEPLARALEPAREELFKRVRPGCCVDRRAAGQDAVEIEHTGKNACWNPSMCVVVRGAESERWSWRRSSCATRASRRAVASRSRASRPLRRFSSSDWKPRFARQPFATRSASAARSNAVRQWAASVSRFIIGSIERVITSGVSGRQRLTHRRAPAIRCGQLRLAAASVVLRAALRRSPEPGGRPLGERSATEKRRRPWPPCKRWATTSFLRTHACERPTASTSSSSTSPISRKPELSVEVFGPCAHRPGRPKRESGRRGQGLPDSRAPRGVVPTSGRRRPRQHPRLLQARRLEIRVTRVPLVPRRLQSSGDGQG